MRKAFSMLTAIVVIVLMAGVTGLVMNLSGKIVNETTAQYRKEQAILLAKSYTEFAILAIQGHHMDTNANGCLETITALVNSTQIDTPNSGGANRGEGYRVTVRLQYIDLPQSISCGTRLDGYTPPAKPTYETSVIIDVNVRYKDMLAMDSSNTQWVNYNRRTLQKL